MRTAGYPVNLQQTVGRRPILYKYQATTVYRVGQVDVRGHVGVEGTCEWPRTKSKGPLARTSALRSSRVSSIPLNSLAVKLLSPSASSHQANPCPSTSAWGAEGATTSMEGRPTDAHSSCGVTTRV
eukprot:285484-Prorocentrum_minimum.AAC.2